MKIILQRRPTDQGWMFGTITVDGQRFCHSLEDELREVKVPGESAIPAGSYRVTIENSPKFGPTTITLNDVPNFSHIRVHAGNRDADTEGCVLVGDQVDYELGTISGGGARRIKERLETVVKAALDRGEEVTWQILNAPGDRYVDSGNLVTMEGVA